MSSNSVYMIGDVDIHDLEEYKKYRRKRRKHRVREKVENWWKNFFKQLLGMLWGA